MKTPFNRIFILAMSLALVLLAFPSAFKTHAMSTDSINVQHGLKAQYYTSSKPAFGFDQLKSTVVDPNIDFDNLEPILQELTGQNDLNTVRWTGQIEPKYSEDYTFYMIGDNGFRLWVNGKLMIDHWVDDWENPQKSKSISLEAGKKYNIKVEFFEDFGGSNLHLSWSSKSQPKEIIPPSAFYLPKGFHYTGPSSAAVSKDGKTLELKFDKNLNKLPNDVADHLKLMNQDHSILSASIKDGDASTLDLQLKYRVTKPTSHVRIFYDGDGGITFADGSKMTEFNANVVNNSTYIISSPWAKDVSKDHPLNKYPRPQMKRNQWMNLNGEWQFEAASKGDPVPTGEKLDGKILVPFPVESKLSGVERNINRMWYKRDFEIPKSWNGEQVLLHFGAVDWKSTVYVNGHEVGAHKGGYDSFTYDITKYLKKGNNELIVGVRDLTSEDHAIGKQRENPGGYFIHRLQEFGKRSGWSRCHRHILVS